MPTNLDNDKDIQTILEKLWVNCLYTAKQNITLVQGAEQPKELDARNWQKAINPNELLEKAAMLYISEAKHSIDQYTQSKLKAFAAVLKIAMRGEGEAGNAGEMMSVNYAQDLVDEALKAIKERRGIK